MLCRASSAIGLRVLLAVAVSIATGCEREPAPTEMYPPGPVILLGFDGLDPDRVAEYEGAGRLPNFARLRERGAVGVVRSTLPMNAASSWATVATGLRPGEHGVWGFGWDAGDRLHLATATDRLAPTLWEELTARGRTVGVFGVPVTSPPDSVDGFFVSGFPRISGAPRAFPPDVADAVASGSLDAFRSGPAAGAEGAWLGDVHRERDAERDTALSLWGERGGDLTFFVFSSPALVQRYLLGSKDPVLASAVPEEYEWCDALLGTILDRMTAETTLLVVSNRGFAAATRAISATWCATRVPEGVRVGARASRFDDGGWFVDPDASADDIETYRAALEVLEHEGQRCFRAVHDLTKQELRGHAAALGPQIVAEPADGFAIVAGDATSPFVTPLAKPVGVPRRRGYFAMLGNFVERGPVRDSDLGDVSALVMHRLGEPIPRRYVHNVPRRLFPLDYFVARPMKFSGRPEDGLRYPSSQTDSPNDEVVESQVRGLGYVH